MSKNFVRCTNTVGVPESMCKLCLRTLVAPDLRSLARAEIRHECFVNDHGTDKTTITLYGADLSSGRKSTQRSVELLLRRVLARL